MCTLPTKRFPFLQAPGQIFPSHFFVNIHLEIKIGRFNIVVFNLFCSIAPLQQWFPNLSSRYPNQGIDYVLLPSIKISRFRWKIYFAAIAHNTEQQWGFGFVLSPKESYITPSLGTTALQEICLKIAPHL